MIKFSTNIQICKRIIVLLITITILNLLAPIYHVSADADNDAGGELFRPICKLFAKGFDLIIEELQYQFMGNGDIEDGIKYGPMAIFSNKIPGLDANFINPKWTEEKPYTVDGSMEIIESTGTDSSKWKDIDGIKGIMEQNGYEGEFSYLTSEYSWKSNGESYKIEIVNENILGQSTSLYSYTLYKTDNTGKVSTSYELQNKISTWYIGLRSVALVGLLSVLVYVGIRIIISSTGTEKAKYKKMIGDWLVAICILFVLHYVMAFTMTITEKIISIFETNGVGANGEDLLMSKIRKNINSNQYSTRTTFTNLILYIVLVIYTCMFTIHYLKRMAYLAFFTMIAPLIALTYPLDKIKDGQAQAFSMWLREYIFNALIPVVHIIIYDIFVGSAADFASSNTLYAVVCIGFLIPAEKFIKKMFGFDKATSSGQLGAAAGGALVMNAINKIGQRSGRRAAGRAGSSGDTGVPEGSAPRYITAPGGGTPGGGTPGGGTSGGGTSGGGTPATRTASSTAANSAISPTSSRARGASALARNYVNKKSIKNVAKSAGRMVRKVGLGALGAGALGTVGLAAGVATGDFSNAFKYGAAGLTAGYMGANKVGDTVTGKGIKFASKNKDLYMEGKWGTDEFNTRNSVKDLKSDTDFNQVCRDLGIKRGDREELIRKFHSKGVTKPEDIKKAMNAGAITSTKNTDAIIDAAKIRQEVKRYGMKPKDIRSSLESRGIKGDDLDRTMNLIDLL